MLDNDKLSGQEQALNIINSDNENAVNELFDLTTMYPQDHIIEFLYGAELAQRQHYTAALSSFKKVLRMLPDYHIARFQLCLLAFSQGDESLFEEYIPMLLTLGEDNYLSVFAHAMNELQQNNIALAIASIDKGLALNIENPPLNNDMMLLKQTIAEQSASNKQQNEEHILSEKTDVHRTHSILLDIYKQKPIKH